MKLNWKRTFIILTDVVLGIYIVLAFTAFNKPDETAKKCTRVNISIADESNNGFITVAEIKKRLVAGGIYPKGQPLRYVDARKIEERLKMSPFVKTAECYKTQDGQVFINITQLLPVIRIKADNGDDYYVDDKNSVMPNSAEVSLPVLRQTTYPLWERRLWRTMCGVISSNRYMFFLEAVSNSSRALATISYTSDVFRIFRKA